MLLRLTVLAVIASLLASCRSAPKAVSSDEDDFALNPAADDEKTDDRGYFSDLQRSDSSIGFESSFPLPFAVGKSIDRFELPPEQAKNPEPSTLGIMLGNCRFTMKTGLVQVDRHILAGQWIKLNEALPASVPVKLEANMDLNLKMITRLNVDVLAEDMAICRNLLSGRRVYLGRFHLNKSRIGLLAGPGYPRAVFSSRSMEPKGKRVYIRWQAGAPAPTLIDDFDFAATTESGIFRALMGEKGYYYLVFSPILRMDQIDQVMIKIPYQPESRSKGERGNRTKTQKRKMETPP